MVEARWKMFQIEDAIEMKGILAGSVWKYVDLK